MDKDLLLIGKLGSFLEMLLNCADGGYVPDANAIRMSREVLEEYKRWLKEPVNG